MTIPQISFLLAGGRLSVGGEKASVGNDNWLGKYREGFKYNSNTT
jgi:hypothetical protein